MVSRQEVNAGTEIYVTLSRYRLRVFRGGEILDFSRFRLALLPQLAQYTGMVETMPACG